MKEQSVCQICENELANLSCEICGKLVGLKCFDKNSGTCVNCRRGKKAEDLGKIY